VTTFAWIVTTLVLVAIAAMVARYALVYARLNGKRVLTCPETGAHVGVDLDVSHAVAGSLFGGKPDLRLNDCTRWPERAGCDQACLRQLEGAPESCKLQTMLSDWYRGQKCSFCRKPFGEINWTDHKPALLAPDLRTVEWKDVRPEMVDLVLGTHAPVCWNCHVTETFRREHPELVTERRYSKTDVEAHHH